MRRAYLYPERAGDDGPIRFAVATEGRKGAPWPAT